MKIHDVSQVSAVQLHFSIGPFGAADL